MKLLNLVLWIVVIWATTNVISASMAETSVIQQIYGALQALIATTALGFITISYKK